MSAEVLRWAATLMRERAEDATPRVCPDWTQSAVRHIARNCDIECFHGADDPALVAVPHDDGTSLNTWDRYDDAPHIASWHPAVALAVADLLIEASVDWPEHPAALAIARAYLGEQP